MKGVVILFSAFALVLVCLTLWVGRYYSSSVCTKCAAIRATQEWQVPGTRITLFARSSESDTPLSITLRTNRLVGPHAHAWLGFHGSGNGVRCALGSGGELFQTAVH